MRTLETVQSHGASKAHQPGGVAWHGLQTTVRVVTVVAALLAFGLLGLLAGVCHLAREPHSVDPACRCCRRRRALALTGTLVLAGLVLVGSGMAVHQRVGGPGLPHCGGELPERATGNLDHPREKVAAGVWLQTRQVLTAPVSGLARHYVNDRGGGLCEVGSLTLGFLPSAASDSGLAVGSVVLTGDQPSMRRSTWEALASHESRHVSQWAVFTLTGGPLAMPLLYAVDEAFFPQSRNHFERAADLEDGGYPHPEGFGPRPQWAKVGVIGLLLVIAGRRRLRWTSRVLIGGAAAARSHERGLCPLHSRGWLRLQATS